MKKIICLCMALLCFTITGCSSNGSDSGAEKITVGIWGGNAAEERAIETVKKDFEEQTGIKVDLKVYTDYNTQIQADFIGGTAPDVFYVDANMYPFFSSLDVLEELDREEMGADSFYSNLLDAFETDGKLYSMPKDVSTLALYYNTDMLEACGYTVADIPENLEDYAKFLVEYQAKLDSVYGSGAVTAMSYNQDLARNLHLLERDGGQVCDSEGNSTLSNEATLTNLDFMLTLVDTGAYKTPSDLGLGWNGEAFGVGKIAIMEEGNWVYKTLEEDYDVNFAVKDMPAYKGEKSSMSFTVGYSIYSGSTKKDSAKEWVKYATGVEGMKTWITGAGTLPARDDVAVEAKINDDAVLAVHLDQIEYAVAWQKGTTISIINDAYKNFLPSAIRKESTSLVAMQNADEKANSEIKNSN